MDESPPRSEPPRTADTPAAPQAEGLEWWLVALKATGDEHVPLGEVSQGWTLMRLPPPQGSSPQLMYYHSIIFQKYPSKASKRHPEEIPVLYSVMNFPKKIGRMWMIFFLVVGPGRGEGEE